MIGFNDGPREVIVRRAEMHDAEAVRACLATAFAPYRPQYTRGAYADTVPNAEAIRVRLSEMQVFIAVGEGNVVGTIAVARIGVEAHLRGMAVTPQWQGTQVAAKLLETAVAEARRCGCRFVTLDTTEPLQRAIHFYRKHGFEPTGRVTDFFGMLLHQYIRTL